MKNLQKLKNNKGITLVALVVTIVVLLILAGISINLVLGENGLIAKAKDARDATKQDAINTEKALNSLYDEMVAAIGGENEGGEIEEEEVKIVSTEEKTGTDGEFRYVELSNGQIQITKYVGNKTEVVIPATYDGHTVYSVGNREAGTTSAIRYNIFGTTNSTSNTTITKITISEGIKEIKTAAFNGCKGLNGNISLPSTLTEIGYCAFTQCSGLTTESGELKIPVGVTKIGYGAFNGCTSLTGNLILPDTLKEIEDGAFYNCSGLTGKLNIPSSIKEIKRHTFSGCSGLTGNLEIPEGVTKIGDYAFQFCSGFNGKLTLPSTLIEIGDGAFNHCSNLTNTYVTIPRNVKTIGANATDGTHIFYDFANGTLTEFRVEAGNTAFKAEDGVLFNESGTRLIAYPTSRPGSTYEIPEGVTIIDELAFSKAGTSAGSLNKIILPNSYTLTTTLPSNYQNVGNNLAVGLYTNTGVSDVEVKVDNQNYKSENGILYSKDGSTLWYVPRAKTGEVVIESGVTTIKSGAFFGNDTMRNQTVIIPASVTEIEATALSRLEKMGSSKVIFNENCIYEFKADGSIGKKE